MSYRIYIELFKDEKSLRSYQIFGNNEFPSELKEWLISNTKLNKEKLKFKSEEKNKGSPSEFN